jgi:hypothetical protein
MPPDVSGPVTTIIGWNEIAPAIAMVGFLVMVGFLLLPLVRAWGRRIEGGAADPALLDELSHLRERVAELDNSVGRMHELEERLDFAERLLTQRAHAALPNQDRS